MYIDVIVRSIGERTLNLCLDAIRAEYTGDIHHICNIYNQHDAYLNCFDILRKSNNRIGICIDADVILKRNWLHDIKNALKIFDDRYFTMIFPVNDYLTDKTLFRGVHVYNNEYSNICYHFMKCNSYLFNNKKIHQYITNKRFITKPESSILLYFESLGVKCWAADIPIGYHGFEQYYAEIFRQYVIRARRDANTHFLNDYKCILQYNYTKSHCKDFQVALFGINDYMHFNDIYDTEKLISNIKNHLREHYNILEKNPLSMSLHDFYSKYSK